MSAESSEITIMETYTHEESDWQNNTENSLQLFTTENNEEVQYVYDGSELVLAPNDTLGNLTDQFILEDGTRAMVVNGTLMTADGQPIILDDGNELSPNSAEENSGLDNIIVPEGQENTILELLNQNNTTSGNEHNVVYIEDVNEGTTATQDIENEIVEYQIADVAQENNGTTMELQEQNQVEAVAGVIDLEQFLNQQGLLLNGEDYQYAVLENGTFHLQTVNDAVKITTSTTEENRDVRESIFYQDIKGKDLQTGQTLYLSKYPKRSAHTRKNLNQNISNNFGGLYTPNSTNPTSKLKRLINKKLTIGRTTQGKLLVGKIVDVMKKDENKTSTLPSRSKKESIRERIKNLPVTEVINLGEDEEDPSFSIEVTDDQSQSEEATILPELKSSSPISTKSLPISKKYSLAESSKVLVMEKVVSQATFDIIGKTLSGMMSMSTVSKQLLNKTLVIKLIDKAYHQGGSICKKNVSYCSGQMEKQYQVDEETADFTESWKFVPHSNSKNTILAAQYPDADQDDSKTITKLTILMTTNTKGTRTTRVVINPLNSQKCETCDKSFKSTSAFKLHKIDCEAKAGILESITMEKEKSETNLDHIQGKYAYECVQCNKNFKTSLMLTNHMKLHFAGQAQPSIENMEPPESDVITTQVLQAAVKNRDQKVYDCTFCGRHFSRYSNLQRHMEIHPGEGAMFRCSICSCSYQYISSLTRHVVTCHMDKARNQISVKPNENEVLEYSDEQIAELIELENMNVNPYYVTNDDSNNAIVLDE